MGQSVLAIITAMLAGTPDGEHISLQPGVRIAIDHQCGPICAVIVANLLDVNVSLADAMANIQNTPDGTSLDSLKIYLESLGLLAVPVRVGANSLHDLDTPVIACVNGSHFVVVAQSHNGQSLLVDPPLEPTWVSSHRLGSRLSGYALVVASTDAWTKQASGRIWLGHYLEPLLYATFLFVSAALALIRLWPARVAATKQRMEGYK
jgi:ABC-type bacteriocin/lantibiotic exporter with double-glycine peptidase domain